MDPMDTSQNTTRSLPLLTTELCALPGMNVMPRTPTNLVHHHTFHQHTDQTKSLQELQNEVGVLLEFRDLVIETFPDLKHKISSSGASSTTNGIQLSSIVSRREWEPGIRVRRKLNNNVSKEGSNNGGASDIQSSSLLIRSRSNSQSGKKEPKSGGEGNGSVIQDSGFSTETSSSKETHSAFSTTGSAGVQGTNNPTTRLSSDTTNDNELWNLLDVIHRRTSRLADEMENLQKFGNRNVNGQSMSALAGPSTEENVKILRKQRDHLLDKMSDMEAEFLASRIKETELHEQLKELQQTKNELEEQLKTAMSQKLELNQSNDGSSSQLNLSDMLSKSRPSNGAISLSDVKQNLNFTFQPIPIKSQNLEPSDLIDSVTSSVRNRSTQSNDEFNQLGRLDGLISNPNKLSKVRVPDSKKITAILLETNIVELQRHLLTITVQNQVLQQKLEQATKSKISLIQKLDKSIEDVEDLKFQIEERNIELEGTRAQLRVIENKVANCSDLSNEHQSNTTHGGIMHKAAKHRMPQTISTPSMKAMIPLTMDETLQHSSSTESAHDQQDRGETSSKFPETPKRSRPSKIPVNQHTKFIAKPPSGRQLTTTGPSSHKSLTKSTSSLYNGQKSSGPYSITKKDSSLTRQESEHSWRNTSLEGKHRSSSIPTPKPGFIAPSIQSTIACETYVAHSPDISTNSPPYVFGPSTPLPRQKRDSLTTKVKYLDSLSRLQSSSTGTLSSGSPVTRPSRSHSTAVNNSNSRKYTGLPVRRISNVSDSHDNNVHDAANEANGGRVRNIRSSIWNWLKI